jgi:hypothetical protein
LQVLSLTPPPPHPDHFWAIEVQNTETKGWKTNMRQQKKGDTIGALLENPKHEAFAKLVAAGMIPGEAYILAGYTVKNAAVSRSAGNRLLSRVNVRNRVSELKPECSAKTLKAIDVQVDRTVLERAGRVAALTERRSWLYQVIQARAMFADHQWAPGASTGLVVTSEKALGKDAIKTHEVDVPLLWLLNDIERQIAIETGQWEEKTSSKVEFKSLDEALAAMPTDVLDREIARLQAEANRCKREGRGSRKEAELMFFGLMHPFQQIPTPHLIHPNRSQSLNTRKHRVVRLFVTVFNTLGFFCRLLFPSCSSLQHSATRKLLAESLSR